MRARDDTKVDEGSVIDGKGKRLSETLDSLRNGENNGARRSRDKLTFWQRRAGRCHRHEDDLSCDGPGHVCSGVLAGGSACRRRTRTRRACRRVGPRGSGSSRARAGLAAPKFAAASGVRDGRGDRQRHSRGKAGTDVVHVSSLGEKASYSGIAVSANGGRKSPIRAGRWQRLAWRCNMCPAVTLPI